MIDGLLRYGFAITILTLFNTSVVLAQSVQDVFDEGGFCVARNVSDNGQVVALSVQKQSGGISMSSDPDAKYHLPALWKDGVLTPLDAGPYTPALIHGISADGSFVSGTARVSTEQTTAVRWVDGKLDLLNIPADNTSNAYAYSVSADSSSVVGSLSSPGSSSVVSSLSLLNKSKTGFIWNGEKFQKIMEPNIPEDVSSDGGVVVGSNFFKGQLMHAAVWDHGQTYRLLGEAKVSVAAAISNDGKSILVEYQMWKPRRQYGLKLIEDGHSIDILPLGSEDPLAPILSGDGKVITTTLLDYNNLSKPRDVAIWREANGWKKEHLTSLLKQADIATTDWKLSVATGLSYDGSVIVGNGEYKGEPMPWRIDFSVDSNKAIVALCD